MIRPPQPGTRRTDRHVCQRMALVLVLALVACSNAGGEDLYRTAGQLTASYCDQLAGLAAWCDQQQLAEQAQQTRRWLQQPAPDKLRVAVLPRTVGQSKLPPDAPAAVVEWNDRFTRLRCQQANALYDLARRAVRSGRASLAFDLVLAAIREDPDHEAVRRLLGYQQFEGQWHTLYEIQNLRSGRVWHEQYGWLPKSYVRRYEAGERFYGGRWITAQEDARLHREIPSGWDIQTEHYTIRTNHSIEAGVQLGTKLEQLYRVWKQLFVRYFASEAQVAALFATRARSGRNQLPRHAVVYFRDRQDYNQWLRHAYPNIEISVGVYVESAPTGQRVRRAYFFAGEDSDQRTLYHEATHQLFHEAPGFHRSWAVAPDVGRQANFWIIEGVAMYMESLRQEDGYHVLGGFDDLRMQAARYRLLKDNFYIPLAEFTSYGMEDIQKHERIATLYSQAAGLTHFLIHCDGGRYRDALVAYLTAVYSGRDDANTLARLTGTTYSELDQQYRRFMQAGPQPAANGR